MRKQTRKQVAEIDNRLPSGDLIGDIRRLIESARQNVAVTVNAGLTILYWQIGSRIRQDILEEKRAEYGKEIVATLSQELTHHVELQRKRRRKQLGVAEGKPKYGGK